MKLLARIFLEASARRHDVPAQSPEMLTSQSHHQLIARVEPFPEMIVRCQLVAKSEQKPVLKVQALQVLSAVTFPW